MAKGEEGGGGRRSVAQGFFGEKVMLARKREGDDGSFSKGGRESCYAFFQSSADVQSPSVISSRGREGK